MNGIGRGVGRSRRMDRMGREDGRDAERRPLWSAGDAVVEMEVQMTARDGCRQRYW